MGDVVNLLGQDQVEKDTLGFDQGIEIAVAGLHERLHADQPRRGRPFRDAIADRHGARRRDETEQPGGLEVDAAVLRADAAEQSETAGHPDAVDEQLGERSLSVRRGISGLSYGQGQTAIAVHGAQVEKDVDGQQVRRIGSRDPVLDAALPCRERAAPGRVLRHHPALAIGHAGLVQDIGDVFAESGKPAILGAIRLAPLEDHRVVLIHRQQALAAAGRAEDNQRIGNGGPAMAARLHDLFGEHRGLTRQGAELAGNHFRNLAARQALVQQRFGEMRQLGPGDGKFVRIPGVIKLRSGEYTSLNLHLDIEQTLKLRGSIIRHTAEMFEPDIFIVDKEPMGLRGEVLETLEMLKPRGTRLVLGLRDVLDEPRLLEPEWQRKNVLPALRDLYDEIWVYGLPQICDPLEGVSLPIRVRQKMIYTGYLHREVPTHGAPPRLPEITHRPYLLVTTGGGGDGEALIEWVLRAYEHDPLLPYPALLVLGPFMQPERQAEFMDRAARLKRVDVITFHSHLEALVARAAGVVAMGGYNTFCEVLSLDKRALIVPRTAPRLEQFIRTSRAASLGLIGMLADDGRYDPAVMAAALRRLPRQNRPSEVVVPGLLEGLMNVARLVTPWIDKAQAEAPPQTLAGSG